MNLFFVRLIETEDGKDWPRKVIVVAYNRKHVEAKLRSYYEVALGGMGITYRVQAIHHITFDAGDCCFLTKRMLP